LSQPSKKGHELRVNVGFLLKETAGYSREILYDADRLVLEDDLVVLDLKGAVQFTRTPDGLLSQGRLTARVEAECGRCLAPTVQPLTANVQELWYYPPEKAPADAELVIYEDANLDLTPLVREHFLLGIPIQVLCRPDCLGLCSICGHDLNLGPCGHEADARDPRLAALGALSRLLDQGQAPAMREGASDDGDDA
jgi:uncharacterized protein